MSRIIVPLVLILTTVGWATETDIGACDSQDSSEQKGRALLQISASSRTRGMQPATSGSSAPLTQAGYEEVAELCCVREMREYIKQIIDTDATLELCNDGGLSGFTLYYDCKDDGQTLETLKNALVVESLKQECPFLASPGSCPTDPNCPVYPGGTFPPCGGSSTTPPGTTSPIGTTSPPGGSTTTPPGTTAPPGTTSPPGGCLAQPMDIFMAIDASDSVKNDGWIAERKFASDIVDKLVGGVNPKNNRINAHWFNRITSPVTPLAGVTEQTGNKPKDKPNANDIGTFVSTAGDVTTLKNDINALQYSNIQDGATDHPQVYLTADAFYSTSASTSNNAKVVILITDGETHKGDKCDELEDPENKKKVFNAVGECSKDTTHPCQREKKEESCNLQKCMCGLYRAYEFKQKGYTLVVVGIKNKHKGTFFEDQMRVMASPDRFYFAKDFDSLPNLVKDIENIQCK